MSPPEAAVAILLATTAFSLLSGCTALVPLDGLSGGAPPDAAVVDAESDATADSEAGAPRPDKVDVLLVIDNSVTMYDKHEWLARAVEDLVMLLADPPCVTASGRIDPSSPQSGPGDAGCTDGHVVLGRPVTDLHLGVISTSLGSIGASACAPSASVVNGDDAAHLLTRGLAEPGDTWANKGFLLWDPGAASTPRGDSVLPDFAAKASKLVLGAGVSGCGLEAPLESWYRFLVDPAPYLELHAVSCDPINDPGGTSCRETWGVDSTILAQRADFLRPDSLLAIVMMTDEDDCSLAPGGENHWLVETLVQGKPRRLPRATSACATQPASPACRTCWGLEAGVDPECDKGPYTEEEDSPQLRCYRQKQRFGVTVQHPISRYVRALTEPTLADGTVNGLFCGHTSTDGAICLGATRAPHDVVIAGIVGVPWQDIAVDLADLGKGSRSGDDLPWDVIAGDPASFKDPTDPYMIPSSAPRTGVNPITGIPIAVPDSEPGASPINSHEVEAHPPLRLQQACAFELPKPRSCEEGIVCPCASPSGSESLCQAPDGSYGNTVYRAGAEPAVRILSVMRAAGPRAVVASACAPRLMPSDAWRPDYGYRGAAFDIARRLHGW